MKNKIYRLVSVSDRLPENDGCYITNIGAIKFEFIGKGWSRGLEDLESIDWWLEEITNPEQAREVVSELFGKFELLPCEDEMKNLYYLNRYLYDFSFAAGMHKGANFILNHIKGGG